MKCPDEFIENDGIGPALRDHKVKVILRGGFEGKNTAGVYRWNLTGSEGDILYWKYDNDDYKCPELFVRNRGYEPGRREAKVEVIFRGSELPIISRSDLLDWSISNCGGDIMCWRYLEGEHVTEVPEGRIDTKKHLPASKQLLLV